MFHSSDELPIGLGMSLAMNKKAMDNYAKLSYEEQKKIVDYVQNNNTGIEAEEKINKAIYNLEIGQINFM